jgi:RNA polymerase sigma-70 factor, ECF subfamily
MPYSDAELLKAIAAGNRAAFAAFYSRHSPQIFGLLVRMLPARADAEDVLQETFLQVWRQAERFDPDRASPFGWLVMMARSRGTDRLRRKSISGTSEMVEPAVLDSSGLEAERQETADRVRQALACLAREQSSAIELAFFGGLTYEEVARRQGIPVGTAKTRIRLGLQHLRQTMGGLTEGRNS